MFRSTIAALGVFALAACFLDPAYAQETKPPPRLIALTGHGEVKAKPDLAVVTVGVLSQSQTARQAVTDNNAAMEKVIASLKAAGIEAKDIQTSNFLVNPRYDYQNNSQPRLIGYDVSNTVGVTVRDLEKLGSILDDVVSEGSNQINGVMFGIAERDRLEDEARKLAVADASRKARIYGEAAQLTLGQIVAISESSSAPPIPVYRSMKAEAASPVPIAEGEQTVAIEVNITWELK